MKERRTLDTSWALIGDLIILFSIISFKAFLNSFKELIEMIRISNGIHIFLYVCQYELRWIDLLVLPQHRKREKDWLFQATKSGESREEMLLKVLLVRPFELD